ncbi:MAG: iron-sulfur cluster assembly accessory protein, partial [Pelagibacteraceae bacterium]|nr:iron-sulfur cluster assembly accessory protein [Pelagibacteraceae bacterium]
CSGFKYDFSFDKNIDQEDVKINNIVIDKVSLEILRGSEIDFISELMGTSFKIFNPKTKSSCGCGISFSI